MNKYFLVIVVSSASMFLQGCSNKTDANEKNFGAAVSQALSERGNLCLRMGLGLTDWPIYIGVNENSSLSRQMDALEKVGLVKFEQKEVPDNSWLSFGDKKKMIVAKSYMPSDKGKKYLQERSSSARGTDKTVAQLCYGKKTLDHIEKWEGPIKYGDYQEASVKYFYKIDDLADWANDADLQKTFPDVKREIDGAEKQSLKQNIKLTSIGWEPKYGF